MLRPLEHVTGCSLLYDHAIRHHHYSVHVIVSEVHIVRGDEKTSTRTG
jgi:hypothetical protein